MEKLKEKLKELSNKEEIQVKNLLTAIQAQQHKISLEQTIINENIKSIRNILDNGSN